MKADRIKQEKFKKLFCENWHKIKPILEAWHEVAERGLIKTFIRGVIKGGDRLAEKIC